jgi:hypothetical protein
MTENHPQPEPEPAPEHEAPRVSRDNVDEPQAEASADAPSAATATAQSTEPERATKLARLWSRVAKRAARALQLKARAARPVVRLTEAELRDRLFLNSGGLVEEIHAIALRQNAGEDQRESRLDAKAQGLLGTAGLSLTVAFTFGGILLQHPEYLEPLGWFARAVLAFYALALLFGLGASVRAVQALYVTDGYRCLSERAVFNDDQLKSVDREAGTDDNKAKAIYRRYITIQHWTNWQETFAVHERKATVIKKGQRLFLYFLFTLILIGCAMTYSAFSRQENPPPSNPAKVTP